MRHDGLKYIVGFGSSKVWGGVVISFLFVLGPQRWEAPQLYLHTCSWLGLVAVGDAYVTRR